MLLAGLHALKPMRVASYQLSVACVLRGTNQEVTGGLRGLQEIDVGFRFSFSVPASVSTVPVAWIVRPAVQFAGLCAFLFPRTPPTTVLIRHGRELSGFKCIRLAFTAPMMAVIVTLSPGWHQGAA